ncbi:phosphatase PAP2 family protein [Cellulomonas sp. PhB143]|uniref:phosphatase PAP2 family protein n=1 Tax=Cellulomonas sp. PhB143 TaxID=2485186 RepID=UPI000F4A15DC|nr:phosphatase PAP2 family protein [Cellulomonas sp. PhB143]ROS75337.1 undecaprenyl-diphosphatase [Cellulomonas sp. PhB143]
MTTFVHRYELDPSRPTGREVARDVVVRGVLPAAALWALVTGVGLLIVGPLGDLRGEDSVDRWFAAHRTSALTPVSTVLSGAGMTQTVIAITVIAALLLWWRSRQWWFALVPALAVSLQAVVFFFAAAVVGRGRPEVSHLDDSPPTTSYPSGHTGASAALWFTLAMLAQRITHPALRWVATVVCVLMPFLVATARLYRGMHAPTDVTMALLNGALCMVVAWAYLRRDVPAVRL